jgi:hypothetical protein
MLDEGLRYRFDAIRNPIRDIEPSALVAGRRQTGCREIHTWRAGTTRRRDACRPKEPEP